MKAEAAVMRTNPLQMTAVLFRLTLNTAVFRKKHS